MTQPTTVQLLILVERAERGRPLTTNEGALLRAGVAELEQLRQELARKEQELATWRATVAALDSGAPGTPRHRAERAEAAIRDALPDLTRAIDCLDATCRYHGDNLDPDEHGSLYRREACCDTGVEPRRAREARQTLDRLRAALDEHQEQ